MRLGRPRKIRTVKCRMECGILLEITFYVNTLHGCTSVRELKSKSCMNISRSLQYRTPSWGFSVRILPSCLSQTVSLASRKPSACVNLTFEFWVILLQINQVDHEARYRLRSCCLRSCLRPFCHPQCESRTSKLLGSMMDDCDGRKHKEKKNVWWHSVSRPWRNRSDRKACGAWEEIE